MADNIILRDETCEAPLKLTKVTRDTCFVLSTQDKDGHTIAWTFDAKEAIQIAHWIISRTDTQKLLGIK